MTPSLLPTGVGFGPSMVSVPPGSVETSVTGGGTRLGRPLEHSSHRRMSSRLHLS